MFIKKIRNLYDSFLRNFKNEGRGLVRAPRERLQIKMKEIYDMFRKTIVLLLTEEPVWQTANLENLN